MKKTIIVNGAFGKMGMLACQTLQNQPEFEVIAKLSRQDALTQVILDTKADIVVDLTRADCVFENAQTIIEAGSHPVIGTSGLLVDDVLYLKKKCDEKKLGGIIVPNFSLSAVLMMKFSAMAARFFEHVEIIEMHHLHKQDAPSGTALKTAEVIRESAKAIQNASCEPLLPGARGATYRDIQIHSLRLPGILAKQQVIFGEMGETLTIAHESIDRQAYMPGLLLACRNVCELPTLYYGLEHLLN